MLLEIKRSARKDDAMLQQNFRLSYAYRAKRKLNLEFPSPLDWCYSTRATEIIFHKNLTESAVEREGNFTPRQSIHQSRFKEFK